MNSETIKEFLVGLGFEVDNASLSKFNASIASAAKRVTGLYLSIKALSAAVFYSISKISEGFEQMGYEYRLIAPAINKSLILRREMMKAFSLAGVDIVRTVQQAIKFNMALTKVQFTFKALFASVAAKFFPILTKQMDVFRKTLIQNMPKITAGLQKFVAFVFKAFEVTYLLGARIWSILQRVYDFFYSLHRVTNGWSTIILGVVTAWKALNLAFLATPIGQLLLGITALIALYDDFKVWQEGGESFFNWSSTLPVIEAVTNYLKTLYGVLENLIGAFVALGFVIYNVFKGRWSQAFDAAKEGINSLKNALLGVVDTFKGMLNIGSSVGSFMSELFGGNPQAISGEAWSKFGQQGQVNPSMPLGVQGAASSVSNTNQNLQQQTTINVMGTADSSSTAQAVASQQGRVNFDIVRNMKGATR